MAPTYLDTLSHFTTFLTAYTHTLLYLRTLYPRTSFVHTRFHNAPVYQSRHPLVCEWIADAVAAVHEELLNGSVAKLAIVIFSYEAGGNGAMGSAKIMERYMFDVSAFPVVDKSDRNMQIAWEGEATPEASDNDEHGQAEETGKTNALDAHVPVDLSEQFRAALLALATRTSVLAPLPPSCSFNISMELKDEGHFDPPIGHAHGWIPVQPSLQKTGREAAIRNEEEKEVVAPGQRRDKEGVDLGGVRVTPIRSVEASVLRFETWIEEGTAKFQTRERGSTKTSLTSSTG